MPEHKYYLHAFWKWLLALLVPIMSIFVWLFVMGFLALWDFVITGKTTLHELNKNGANAKGVAAMVVLPFLLPALLYRSLVVLYGIGYNPHVVLNDKGVKGQVIVKSKWRIKRGTLRYGDIGNVTGGSLFGVGYKCFYSASLPDHAILIFTSVRNAQECFAIINQRRQVAHA